MTAKFTPGPWKSETIRYKDGDMFVRITTAYDDYDGEDCIGPETICTIGGFPTIALDGGKQWEATGRLMSAAPELYDALVGQVDNWKSQTCPMFINSGTEPEQCYYCVNKKCEAARQIKTIRDLLERINGEESK